MTLENKMKKKIIIITMWDALMVDGQNNSFRTNMFLGYIVSIII